MGADHFIHLSRCFGSSVCSATCLLSNANQSNKSARFITAPLTSRNLIYLFASNLAVAFRQRRAGFAFHVLVTKFRARGAAPTSWRLASGFLGPASSTSPFIAAVSFAGRRACTLFSVARSALSYEGHKAALGQQTRGLTPPPARNQAVSTVGSEGRLLSTRRGTALPRYSVGIATLALLSALLMSQPAMLRLWRPRATLRCLRRVTVCLLTLRFG
jgi:hypothetical protein